MVEISTIARPYAEAAFQVAVASSLGQWSDWLKSWSVVASDESIKLLVDNPKLTDEQVLQVFVEIARAPEQTQARNFLSMLVENRRLLILPEISSQFEELKSRYEGFAEALIVSAFPMMVSEVQNIRAGLEKKFDSRLNITVQVDESLIGGICVTVGDQVLDNSVRGKLNVMKAALTA